MKNILTPFICLALLLVPGCGKTIPGDTAVTRIYKATFEDNTRTTVNTAGNVSWSEGDWILYYSKDAGLLRSYTVEQDAAMVSMPLTVASDATYLVAVYGTRSISSYGSNSLILENAILEQQDGSFAQGHLAISKTEDVTAESLVFENLTSFISFSTERSDIDHIVFTSNDGVMVNGKGKVQVSFSGTVPTASFGSDGGYATMVKLNGAGTYLIATLPHVFEYGFEMACYSADNVMIGKAIADKSFTLKPSSIFNVGLIDAHIQANMINGNGYNNDYNWDYSDICNVTYSGTRYDQDENWDNGNASGGNISGSGYGNDANWDNGSGSNGGVSGSGYGGDTNWDNNSNSNGNISGTSYGNDANWD